MRRGLNCTYEHSRPTNTSDTNTSSPQPNPLGSRQDSQPTHREDHLLHAGLNRQEELCLVHHYTTQLHLGTSPKGSSGRLDTAKIWRDMPFHDGMTYAFVLDAVLAVAALHKAYSEPQHSKKYVSACLYYQNQCLTAYQKQLTNINEDNCNAMFAVSALIHVLNGAMSRGGPYLPPTPPIETLLSQLKLGFGIKTVLDATWDTVRVAHYKEILIRPEPSTPPDATNSPEVAYAMDELQRCVADTAMADAATRDVYATSVASLDDVFRQVEQDDDLDAIAIWPILLNEKVTELLEKRDPLMMLICIHYGVLCLHLHDRWWAHNFGCRLIWDLSEMLHALDASWLPLTSWARSKAASVRAASAQVEVW
jgi:hypothetical protein